MREIRIEAGTVPKIRRAVLRMAESIRWIEERQVGMRRSISLIEKELDAIHMNLNRLTRDVQRIQEYLEVVEEAGMDDGK